jgi:2'-5' RNA ligase
MTTPGAPLVALDVAILLPPPIAAVADAVNAELVRQRPEGFRFGRTHLPHVTLAQLFARRSNVERLADRIRLVLRGRPPVPLRTTRLARGRTTVSIEIAATAALQQLHEQLMATVSPFEERNGGVEAFLEDGEPARPADVEWVTGFRTGASFERFTPHITLGIGHLTSVDPFQFVAGRVALCHLGRFCTCRTIVREWELRERSSTSAE